jgi:periplasmic protein TonB
MHNKIDQLDEGISAMLAARDAQPAQSAEARDLLEIARSLQHQPSPTFRASLRADLLSAMERQASSPVETTTSRPSSELRAPTNPDTIVPPRFLTGASNLPVRTSHLVLSFALHAVALGLIGASSYWVVEHRATVRMKIAELIPASEEDIPLPIAPGAMHGGGGGGDQDKLPASHGTPPRFASEQLTPPAVIVRNEDPKLPAEPTLIGPPDLILPQSDKYGDPMANILNPPSNGPGSGGGIGSGHTGGIGSGEGPGVGEGYGGGIGGGIYHVGGGVSAPRPIYDPDPEYSDEARKAKFQGSCVLVAIIGPDGRPRDLRVARSLGMGLDQKAVDAVWKWRFVPAMKDNRPVSVQISIEVVFHLY